MEGQNAQPFHSNVQFIILLWLILIRVFLRNKNIFYNLFNKIYYLVAPLVKAIQTVPVMAGDDALLKCSAEQGFPQPDLYWTREVDL